MKLLIFLLSLIPFSLSAQTAAVPALPVPIPPLTAPLPAVVDPGQSVTINIPNKGGPLTFKLPQRTLLPASQTTTKPATTTTAATPAPVTLPSYSFVLTDVTAAQIQAFLAAIASNQNATLTGVTITLVPTK